MVEMRMLAVEVVTNLVVLVVVVGLVFTVHGCGRGVCWWCWLSLW